MSSILLYPEKNSDEEQKLLASLPDRLRAKAKIVKHPIHFRKTWEKWKENFQGQVSSEFLFFEHPLALDPSVLILELVNVELTHRILNQHREIFAEASGINFEPSKEIENLRKGGSPFWERVFSDVFCQGLLYGYGESNSRLFAQMIKGQYPIEKLIFSTDKSVDTFQSSSEDFTIPKFRMENNDKTAKNYQSEKKTIQKIYNQGDVFQITMHRLIKEK